MQSNFDASELKLRMPDRLGNDPSTFIAVCRTPSVISVAGTSPTCAGRAHSIYEAVPSMRNQAQWPKHRTASLPKRHSPFACQERHSAHRQLRMSFVLVMRTQVQPVPLQTRFVAGGRLRSVSPRVQLAIVDPELAVEGSRGAALHRQPAACRRCQARLLPTPAPGTAVPAAGPEPCRSPPRCAARAGPAARRSDAGRRRATQRTHRRPDAVPATRAGSARKRRGGLRRPAPRRQGIACMA